MRHLPALAAMTALPFLVPFENVAAQSAAYLDHAALTTELQSLASGSNAARLTSLGSTAGGREIWIMEIASTSGAPVGERPGLLIVGNLEGDHLVGSALALETARYFLSSSADSTVQRILSENVVYIVPRLNPDAAEAMFADARYARRGNARPYDDDNDGRIDEDPGEDLNGDGVITVMRVPDPLGAYVIDSENDRLMKSADAGDGESGGYAVYIEGTDSDGDGYYNEDGAGGVDLNRNFQHEYPYWEPDAGPHMVSEVASRALMDFMIAHRNIAAVLTFGHSDNLVTAPNSSGALAGPSTLDLSAFANAANQEFLRQGVFAGPRRAFGGFGGFFFGGGGGGGQPRLRGAQPGADNDPDSGRRPATTVNAADLQYFEKVSEAYREITGITKVGVNRRAEGAFFQYGYFQFGVPSFSTQGWALPAEESAADSGGAEPSEGPAARGGGGRGGGGARPGAGPGGGRPGGPGGFRPGGGRPGQAPGGGGGAGGGADGSILDALEGAGIDAFVDWTPFTHPQLGDVEIGGFRPYAVTNPPADQLPELGQKHGEFAARLAGMLPRVAIASTEVVDHGGGVFTVSAEIENTGYFPTSLRHGVVSRSVAPTTVQIQVAPEAVLTGDAKSHTVQTLDGSGARECVSWVIRGQQGSTVDIRVVSQKSGSATATVTLR